MKRTRENIRWDLHERHLQTMFALHLMQDRFCDVTLACKDGQTIRVHRAILCACSDYFDSVLTNETSGKDTLVIMKDCDYQDIQLIIQFMYYGEINVDENRIRSILKTAESLQIKGLKNAYRNMNEQDRYNSISVADRHVQGAAPNPLIDSEQMENKMDKKEPDWSDNEDENECVLVYLVSDDEENSHSDREQIADVVAERPGSAMPKTFLPFQDIHMKRCNRNTNESAVASNIHFMDPLDGQMEFEDDEDFKGWYLVPVDDEEQQNERVDPFEIGSITKKIKLKNIVSRSRNRTKQALVPSNNENSGNRNAPLTKSLSRRSAPGTCKMDLLTRLRRSLQHKFDGSIRELNIDDLQNYSVANGKGSCRIKCPICDEHIAVHYYRHNGSLGTSFWNFGGVARHIIRFHFK